jgi:CheY-like chemotaxis protein
METSQPESILLATSDPANGGALLDLISPCGRAIVQASSVPEAEEALSDGIWLAFCEDRLPGGGYGEFLRRTKLAGSQVPVVVSSSLGGPEQYLEAMRLGAHDYITVPYQRSAINLIMQQRCEERRFLVLPVQVYGVDAAGLPFLDSAHTLDVSSQGAKLGGIRRTHRPGNLVGVLYCETASVFRVAWVQSVEEPSGPAEVGIQILRSASCPWNFH